jgi:hypothetical protein
MGNNFVLESMWNTLDDACFSGARDGRFSWQQWWDEERDVLTFLFLSNSFSNLPVALMGNFMFG